MTRIGRLTVAGLVAGITLGAGAATATDPAAYEPAGRLLRADPGRSFAAYVAAAREHLERHKVAVPGFARAPGRVEPAVRAPARVEMCPRRAHRPAARTRPRR